MPNVCLKLAVICAGVAVSPGARGRREEQEKIFSFTSLFINQGLTCPQKPLVPSKISK